MLGADITNLSLHSYQTSLINMASSPQSLLAASGSFSTQHSRQAPPVSRGQLKRKLISISKMVDLPPQACGHAKEAKMNIHEESFHKYGYA